MTKHLKAGENELVAEVRNDGGASGFVLKLAMMNEKGETRYIVSDDDLDCIGKERRGRALRREEGGQVRRSAVGQRFRRHAPGSGHVASARKHLRSCFPASRSRSCSPCRKNELGSWVSLTADDKGRLIASDQEGKGLVRITPRQDRHR